MTVDRWGWVTEVRVEGPARSRDEVTALLGAIERHVEAAPERAFEFAADGTATLVFGDRRYGAGRFEIPTLAELRRRAGTQPRGVTRLSLLRGASPLTDIGTLQGRAPERVLFQAASQLNCLEAPGLSVWPIHRYTDDSTQGPRASVSAFPGTFLRHFRAPRRGGHFVQRDGDCLDLLADAVDPAVAHAHNGYLTSESIRDVGALERALEDNFDRLRIGLHDVVEVVLGSNWGGHVAEPHPRIAQAFTSTVALGGYSDHPAAIERSTIPRQLLRAAYLGTLLGALALGKEQVVLTLIGGGAFGNPDDTIWDAIRWALDETDRIAARDLHVLVNLREGPVRPVVLERVRATGGTVIAGS